MSYIKQLLVLSLTFFLSFMGLAQETYKVSYHAEVKTQDGRQDYDFVSLIMNNNESLFFHPNWPTKSIYKDVGKKYPKRVAGAPEKRPVYTNLIEEKQVCKSGYRVADKDGFIFTEKIPSFDWGIQSDQKTIGPYSAQKATCSYGGRNYVAWYTMDIPLPFGPYRFGGLPGLILSIHSTDGIVSYEFASLSVVDDEAYKIAPPIKGQHFTEEEFTEYLLARLLRVENMGDGEYIATIDSPGPDYTIEKNRWTVIKDYKAERGY